jgi:F-type H+-transporting ATPase subunit beta
LTQPFFVAEAFTGRKGVYISIEETLQGFEKILDGKVDIVPERFFYMTGTIDQVLETYQHEMALKKEQQQSEVVG